MIRRYLFLKDRLKAGSWTNVKKSRMDHVNPSCFFVVWFFGTIERLLILRVFSNVGYSRRFNYYRRSDWLR